MSIIINWIISALAIIITAYILPGVMVSGFVAAILTAAVLGLVNAILKPILLFLTLPINILTLGLFTLVVNAILIMIVDAIVPGFKVRNFWWALIFSIVLAIVNYILYVLLPD